jgi:VIT1/CCC1 family predicted Fe2+/Mn2+ transporter
LEKIVEVVIANPDVWVEVMMSKEFQMSPPKKSHALNSGLVVGVAALLGSLIPLTPFFSLKITLSIWASIAISALTLFAVGFYKARTTVGKPFHTGV